MTSKIIRYCLILFSYLFFNMTGAVSNQVSSLTEESRIEDWCKTVLESGDGFSKIRPMIYVDFDSPQGWPFASYISDRYPHLLHYSESFRAADSIGSPSMADFGALGYISAPTLRYIKTAGDLEQLFGNLDNTTIVEIGGGFGGQCYILSVLFSFKEYIIVDLPGVLELQKKYLDKLGVKNVRYLPHNELPSEMPCDVVISNYAFSECSYNMRMEYIEKILKHSKHGYMNCNYQGDFNVEPFIQCFQALVPNVWVVPDDPIIGPSNRILWEQ